MNKYMIGGVALLVALVAGITFLVTRMYVQMDIDKAIQIHINGKVPIEAQIDSTILISLMNDLQTQIRVNDNLKIQLNEKFNVPLKMDLDVPLNTEVYMDQVLDLEFDLPVDIVLDQNEMPLKDLVIPFNHRLKVNDSLDMDFSIPLETKIRTNFKRFFNIGLPVKGVVDVQQKIPIHQPLLVSDTLVLSMQDYQIPLKTTIPVQVKIPVKQKVKIEGELMVPVNQNVEIPLQKVISTPVLEPFTANVTTKNDVVTNFKSNLKANASFNKPLRVEKMDSLQIDPSKIQIHFK
ncbi:MAG: hypothetical protein M9958_02285 [Chitinophagales bacterium]|nr:hypothetical protein [Chitinophagales bacterium]